MSDRGEYRAIRRVLLDGPDFQALSERARWVFVALKLNFGVAGIEVWYPAELVARLSAQTGASNGPIQEALNTLELGGWIRREGNVVWIIGQLANDPHVKVGDKKHRTMIQRHIEGLPRLAIVSEFVRANEGWFRESGEPVEALARALSGPSGGLRSTEDKDNDKNEDDSLVPSGDDTGGMTLAGDYPTEFETIFAVYPKRAGSNSKKDAYAAWRARLRSGVPAEALLAGVQRYAAFCAAERKVGTKFVMLASTFFGTGDQYLEPWDTSTLAIQPRQLSRGSILLDLFRRYDLFAYNGNRDEYEAKLTRAADDPLAGSTFRAEVAAVRPSKGDVPGLTDYFKAQEIDRRLSLMAVPA